MFPFTNTKDANSRYNTRYINRLSSANISISLIIERLRDRLIKIIILRVITITR